MTDKIKVKILPDGTLKWSTDSVSDLNHGNAEKLLREIEVGMGGKTIRSKNKNHMHQHNHNHDHNHKH